MDERAWEWPLSPSFVRFVFLTEIQQKRELRHQPASFSAISEIFYDAIYKRGTHDSTQQPRGEARLCAVVLFCSRKTTLLPAAVVQPPGCYDHEQRLFSWPPNAQAGDEEQLSGGDQSRMRKSCDYCVRMKRACDGKTPCELCTR